MSTDITASTHAMATGHIPGYLPGADGSDPLFTGVVVGVIVMVLIVGSLYFKLHAIPEHMAHSDNHAQMQVIGILALLALFTHNNIYWVIALLVAAFRMPDFLSPLQSIARSLESLNKLEQEVMQSETAAVQPDPAPAPAQASGPQQPQGESHA